MIWRAVARRAITRASVTGRGLALGRGVLRRVRGLLVPVPWRALRSSVIGALSFPLTLGDGLGCHQASYLRIA